MKVVTLNVSDRSFAVAGPYAWNSIPVDVHRCSTFFNLAFKPVY